MEVVFDRYILSLSLSLCYIVVLATNGGRHRIALDGVFHQQKYHWIDNYLG